MQTGVDGERWERLGGSLLESSRALGTWMGTSATLVTADVQKLAVGTTAEAAVEIPASEVWGWCGEGDLLSVGRRLGCTGWRGGWTRNGRLGLGRGATKGLIGLRTRGAINGAMTVGVTRDAVWERFFLQDVVVQLVIDFSPRHRWVRGSHIAEGSVVHDPCRSSKLPAELAHLVLVGQEVRSKKREVVEDCS